ncbi:MAG: ATP-binding protein, partial [Bacillota bacterium]|nr:ATP-binding protein [Bacillota bacterium]
MSDSCSLIRSCGLYGIEGILVDIEVSILPGLPSFDIVGLGDSAVRESRDRVHAAICNTGFTFPVGHLIASYAPAWLRKEGSAFDLPLALAILAASRQIRLPDQTPCVIGELGLNGDIRRVPGVFCRALTCRDKGIKHIYVPAENSLEARSVLDQGTVGIRHLSEAARIFMPEHVQLPADRWSTADRNPARPGDPDTCIVQTGREEQTIPDIGQIVGQEKAIRALIIAAAGRHNLLLLGSPGCGKTSLAETLPGLLPDLTEDESIQVTRIYSASGLLPEQSGLMSRRPFRNPHHAITRAAMIGGGAVPVPGEVSLA